MSTQKQNDANRENAQHSTGPTSEAGKQRSSLNATRHGLTGQTLVLSPAETENYHALVKSYYEHYAPFDVPTVQLTQQLADAHWSLQQISVQQSNVQSLINAATAQLTAAGDPLAALIALAPHTKTLQTLNLYEQRRRRAADAIELKLLALKAAHAERIKKELPVAAQLSEAHEAEGKPFHPAEFGFVCSSQEIQRFLLGRAMAKRAEGQNSEACPEK